MFNQNDDLRTTRINILKDSIDLCYNEYDAVDIIEALEDLQVSTEGLKETLDDLKEKYTNLFDKNKRQIKRLRTELETYSEDLMGSTIDKEATSNKIITSRRFNIKILRLKLITSLCATSIKELRITKLSSSYVHALNSLGFGITKKEGGNFDIYHIKVKKFPLEKDTMLKLGYVKEVNLKKVINLSKRLVDRYSQYYDRIIETCNTAHEMRYSDKPGEVAFGKIIVINALKQSTPVRMTFESEIKDSIKIIKTIKNEKE